MFVSRPKTSQCLHLLNMARGVGRGRGGEENYSTKSYMGRLCPEVQLLTLFNIPFLKVEVPLLFTFC